MFPNLPGESGVSNDSTVSFPTDPKDPALVNPLPFGPPYDYQGGIPEDLAELGHALPPPPPASNRPPGDGGFILPPIATFQSIINLASRTYLANFDQALHDSRYNALVMRYDPVVMDAIRSRQIPVVQLPWHIEADDENDPAQKDMVDESTKIVKAIPRFFDIKRQLMEAVFFGKYAVQTVMRFNWYRGFRRLMIADHAPVMGDKVVMTFGGRPGILVHGAYAGPRVITDMGLAHLLSPKEREQFILHTFEPEDADLFEGDFAGQRFGYGVRGRIYWWWWQRNVVNQWMLDFLQQIGVGGIMIYYYEEGNAASFAAAQAAAQNQQSSQAILIPRRRNLSGGVDEVNKVDRVEASLAGADLIYRVIVDYYNQVMRDYIVGQRLTTRTGATGLGSQVGEAHERTAADIQRYDAEALAETITRDMLWVIQKYTWPKMPPERCPLKFKFDVDMPNPAEFMAAATQFIALGGTVKEDQARAIIGMEKPKEGDPVLGGPPQMPPGLGGMPGMRGMPPGLEAPPNGQPLPMQNQPVPGDSPFEEVAGPGGEGAAMETTAPGQAFPAVAMSKAKGDKKRVKLERHQNNAWAPSAPKTPIPVVQHDRNSDEFMPDVAPAVAQGTGQRLTHGLKQEGPLQYERGKSPARDLARAGAPKMVALPIARNLGQEPFDRNDLGYREAGDDAPQRCETCALFAGVVMEDRLGECGLFQKLHDTNPERWNLYPDVGLHMVCDAWNQGGATGPVQHSAIQGDEKPGGPLYRNTNTPEGMNELTGPFDHPIRTQRPNIMGLIDRFNDVPTRELLRMAEEGLVQAPLTGDDVKAVVGTRKAKHMMRSMTKPTPEERANATAIIADAVAKTLEIEPSEALGKYIDPGVWKAWLEPDPPKPKEKMAAGNLPQNVLPEEMELAPEEAPPEQTQPGVEYVDEQAGMPGMEGQVGMEPAPPMEQGGAPVPQPTPPGPAQGGPPPQQPQQPQQAPQQTQPQQPAQPVQPMMPAPGSVPPPPPIRPQPTIDQITERRAQEQYDTFREKYLKGDDTVGKKGQGTYDAEGRLESIELNTDEWRDLFPEYHGTNSSDVHEASSFLNNKLLRESLEHMKGVGNNTMLIKAGGGGSGKSGVKRFFNETRYPIRLDQVSDAVEKLQNKIDMARKAGYDVDYVFVDRDPEEAWFEGVVSRALRLRAQGKLARTVLLKNALRSNLNARKTAIEMLRSRTDIPVAAFDNTQGFENARLIKDRDEAIAHLSREIGDYETLYPQLRARTLAMYRLGQIPEDIAIGLLGSLEEQDEI